MSPLSHLITCVCFFFFNKNVFCLSLSLKINMPRASYTVQQKLDVLRLVEKNKNLDRTARELNINRRTIQKWRACKQKLLAEATKSSGARCRRIDVKKKIKGGRYKELETKLSDFIKERREKR